MEQTNTKIRQAAAVAGVKYWQIAKKLHIADATFSRQLRKEFPDGKREQVLQIIRELEQERKEEAQRV